MLQCIQKRCLILFIFLIVSVSHAVECPPNIKWKSCIADNVVVHYSESTEPYVKQILILCESYIPYFENTFNVILRPKIHIILSDYEDSVNGSATSIPVPIITINLIPPEVNSSIDHYHEWIKMILVHELTHIYHMHMGRGIYKPLQRLFGQNVSPMGLLPVTMVEGLAVYYESEITGKGRIVSPYLNMHIRSDILNNKFVPISRTTSYYYPAWPLGINGYFYGGLYHSYIASQFTEQKILDWNKEQSGHLPYLTKSTFMKTFSYPAYISWFKFEQWGYRHYRDEIDRIKNDGTITKCNPITINGGEIFDYTINNDTIYLSRYTPKKGFQLIKIDSNSFKQKNILSIQASSGINDIALNDTIIYFTKNISSSLYRDFYDVFSYSILTKRINRITHKQHIIEVDANDSGELIGIQQNTGKRTLVRINPTNGDCSVLSTMPFDVFDPSISPNGSFIAMSIHRSNTLHDIVLFDMHNKTYKIIASSTNEELFPVWSSDGRLLTFTATINNIYNIYAYDFDNNKYYKLTHMLSAAVQGKLSPDMNWLYFNHYTTNGFNLARIPIDKNLLAVYQYPNEIETIPETQYYTNKYSSQIYLSKKTIRYNAIKFTRMFWTPTLQAEYIYGRGKSILSGIDFAFSDPLDKYTYTINIKYNYLLKQVNLYNKLYIGIVYPKISFIYDNYNYTKQPVITEYNTNSLAFNYYHTETIGMNASLAFPLNPGTIGTSVKYRYNTIDTKLSSTAPTIKLDDKSIDRNKNRHCIKYNGSVDMYINRRLSFVHSVDYEHGESLDIKYIHEDDTIQFYSESLKHISGDYLFLTLDKYFPFVFHSSSIGLIGRSAFSLNTGITDTPELNYLPFITGLRNPFIIEQQHTIRNALKSTVIYQGSIHCSIPLVRINRGSRLFPLMLNTIAFVPYGIYGYNASGKYSTDETITIIGSEIHIISLALYYILFNSVVGISYSDINKSNNNKTDYSMVEGINFYVTIFTSLIPNRRMKKEIITMRNNHDKTIPPIATYRNTSAYYLQPER